MAPGPGLNPITKPAQKKALAFTNTALMHIPALAQRRAQYQ